MKKEKIRWGILGAGVMSHAFAKDFKYMQHASLAAVAARDAEKAKIFAAEYKIPLALSYEELYRSNDIDAVYIATTHNFHYEQTAQCLLNGKAVLGDQPDYFTSEALKLAGEGTNSKHIYAYSAFNKNNLLFQWQATETISQVPAIPFVRADFFNHIHSGKTTIPGPFSELAKLSRFLLNEK